MMIKLGEYIERFDRRNSENEFGLEDVRGISNTKEIMTDSRANLIGRDFSKFTILKDKEFIFNRRTSRNGERISLGYNNLGYDFIITEDYVPFRIKENKKEELLSDFLYLFFLNPEFDRYARFHSWGSATEFFNYDDMCNVDINIPDIEVQKKTIHNYFEIENRINSLKNYNTQLENYSFMAYIKLIDESKISGNRIGIIEEIGKFTRGKNITAEEMSGGNIPVISAGLEPSGYHNISNVKGPSITISGSGVNSGFVSFHSNDIWAADCSYNNDSKYIYFLYETLISLKEEISKLQKGSAQPHVYARDINPMEICIPSEEEIIDFEKEITPLFNMIYYNNYEIENLRKLQLKIVESI